jgi:hypothetical protein
VDRRKEEAVAMRAAASSFRDVFQCPRHNHGKIMAMKKVRSPVAGRKRVRGVVRQVLA